MVCVRAFAVRAIVDAAAAPVIGIDQGLGRGMVQHALDDADRGAALQQGLHRRLAFLVDDQAAVDVLGRDVEVDHVRPSDRVEFVGDEFAIEVALP